MAGDRSLKSASGNAVAAELAQASRTARQRSSSALCVIASAFLAAAVLRANDLRHDVVSLIASPAQAAVPAAEDHPPADGGEIHAAMPTKDGGPDGAMAPKAENAAGGMPGKTMPGKAMPGKAMDGEPECLDGAFLAAARERERELDRMGLALDERRRELQVVETRIAAQLAELARQQEALQAAFGQAEAAAEEEAMQLVAIYEQMKPKQAAPIFDQMPPAVAAGFVRRMRKTSSALIMANMDPQKAYAISLLLAGRSGAVRQQ